MSKLQIMRRWRAGVRVLSAALGLLLILAGTGQPVLAQPRSQVRPITTEMITSILPYLCLGETSSIRVRLQRVYHPSGAGKPVIMPRNEGILIVATVKGDSVTVPLPVQQLSYAATAPGVATFEVHAAKIGPATINFRADVTRLPGEILENESKYEIDYVDTTAPAKVIYCDMGVSGTSTFKVPGMEITAAFGETLMKADADGIYHGEAAIKWVGSWDENFGCHHEFQDAPETKADLSGTADDNGNLEMTIKYDAASAKWDTNCGGPIQSTDPAQLDPALLSLAAVFFAGQPAPIHKPQSTSDLQGEAVIHIVRKQGTRSQ